MPTQASKPRQPLGLRLWHWLNAFTIFGLLGTVLLRKTFLSWRANSVLIEREAAAMGIEGLTAERAATIAKALRDPMWEWHYLLGTALAGLLLVRIVLGMLSAEQDPVRSTLRAAARYLPLSWPQKKRGAHDMLVKAGYLLFYAALLFMSVTGLSLHHERALGLSRETVKAMKEAHELALPFIVLFVAGHLVGVVVAELRGRAGIVSDMLNGGSRSGPQS